MLFRVTENVSIQDTQGPQQFRMKWESLRGDAAADPKKLSHVINFYRGDPADQQTQQITANSMRATKLLLHHAWRAMRSENSHMKTPARNPT